MHPVRVLAIQAVALKALVALLHGGGTGLAVDESHIQLQRRILFQQAVQITGLSLAGLVVVAGNIGVVAVFPGLDLSAGNDHRDARGAQLLNGGGGTGGVAAHDDHGLAAHIHQRFHIVQLGGHVAVGVQQNRLPATLSGNALKVVRHGLHGGVHGVQRVADEVGLGSFGGFCGLGLVFGLGGLGGGGRIGIAAGGQAQHQDGRQQERGQHPTGRMDRFHKMFSPFCLFCLSVSADLRRLISINHLCKSVL